MSHSVRANTEIEVIYLWSLRETVEKAKSRQLSDIGQSGARQRGQIWILDPGPSNRGPGEGQEASTPSGRVPQGREYKPPCQTEGRSSCTQRTMGRNMRGRGRSKAKMRGTSRDADVI